jgi:hypothetical protein
MLQQLDQFYLDQPEPNRSFMLGLRDYILSSDDAFTEHWKWKLPFFYYNNKPFCYIWKDAKTQQPYLGIVKADLIEHPLLIQGNRKKMKVLYFDITKDIPIDLLDEIFSLLKVLC